MNRTLRNIAIKVLIFAGLLALFYSFGGFHWPETSVHHTSPRNNRVIGWFLLNALYVAAALIAVWGDKVVGTIHPVSFRSAYVIIGASIMFLILLPGLFEIGSNRHHPNRALGTNAPQGELGVPRILQERPDLQELRRIDE